MSLMPLLCPGCSLGWVGDNRDFRELQTTKQAWQGGMKDWEERGSFTLRSRMEKCSHSLLAALA